MNNIKQTYTYNDIGLVPTEKSTLRKRSDASTKHKFLGLDIDMPLLLAPMNTVVHYQMLQKMWDLSTPVVMPRNITFNSEFAYWNSWTNPFAIPSVGSDPNDINITEFKNHNKDIICIDVAHAHSVVVEDSIKKAKDHGLKVITGNVASLEGFLFLAELGVDAVRCGISIGSACSTGVQTGCITGIATLIYEIAEYANNHMVDPPAIIADGGIRSPGDVGKALALGADIVMVGSVFAGTYEAPGEHILIDGKNYKKYAGQASAAIKGHDKHIEGAEFLIPAKGPAEIVWLKYQQGLQSTMSYLNCRTVEQLIYQHDENLCILSNNAQLDREPHAQGIRQK